MREILRQFQNEKYRGICSDDSFIIKDLRTGKFYELDTSEFEKSNLSYTERKSKFNDIEIGIIALFFVVIYGFNIYISLKEKYYEGNGRFSNLTIMFLLYMIIFIFFHEMGHFLCLKICGIKECKFGVKINYIFLSFYIRMNDIYLLTKNEKLFVHSGGLVVSVLLNAVTYLFGLITHNEIICFLTQIMVWDIVMNTIPVFDSDGYKILLTLLNINERRQKDCNKNFIKFCKVRPYQTLRYSHPKGYVNI